MFNIRNAGAVLVIAALARPAMAQMSAAEASEAKPSPFITRSAFSVAFTQIRPQGALGKNIGLGYGANGAYLFRIDRAGVLSVRTDIGAADYGDESKRTALSETVGGRVQVNVRTSNYIIPVTIGPQLMWPTGPVRPYVNAGVGGQGFVTESRVENTDGGSPLASTTNHSDFALAWSTGGGVYAPVYTGKIKVLLDLGVQYLSGGKARYLHAGSIVDLPNGQVSISPSTSETHIVIVRAGVRIGL